MRLIRSVIVFGVLFSCVVSARQAQDANSVAALQARAESGDVKAQVAVAFTYRSEGNFAESLKWYRLAAKQGSANAMFNIATHYYNGDGLEVDDRRAYIWFWLGREAGSQTAEDGVTRLEQNYTVDWVHDKKLSIADMMLKGDEIPRDVPKGLNIYEMLAQAGMPNVRLRLAYHYIVGDVLPKDYNAAQKQCAMLSEHEDTAMACLGFLRDRGLVENASPAAAFSWFERAAQGGNPISQLRLGEMYLEGRGTKADPMLAYPWILRADYNGLPAARKAREALEKQLPAKFTDKVKKQELKKFWKDPHGGKGRFFSYEFPSV